MGGLSATEEVMRHHDDGFEAVVGGGGGWVVVMLRTFTPPTGFARRRRRSEAEVGVEQTATFTTLLDQHAIFIVVAIAGGLKDGHDEQDGSVAKPVDPARVGVGFERADRPGGRDDVDVGHHDERGG